MADDAARSAARALELRDSGLMSRQSIDQAVAARRGAGAAGAARAQVGPTRCGWATRILARTTAWSARAPRSRARWCEGAELLRLQRRAGWNGAPRCPPPTSPGSRRAGGRIASGTGHLEGACARWRHQVDPQTRTGLVYVDLPAGDGVRAGQFARRTAAGHARGADPARARCCCATAAATCSGRGRHGPPAQVEPGAPRRPGGDPPGWPRRAGGGIGRGLPRRRRGGARGRDAAVADAR